VITLAVKETNLQRIIMLLVAFSVGTMMGGAFLHLMPEAAELLPTSTMLTVTLASFIGFYFIEKIFYWRHCHDGHCHEHAFGYMNLLGDAVHNFIDGLLIAATFATDIHLGIITSLAVATHEIPQEIGDFGVLLHAGFSKKKAIFSNLAVAMTTVLGGVIGYFLSSADHTLVPYLLPVAAGGFLYIGASDLLPEMRKEPNRIKSFLSFGLYLLGIGFMLLAD
jgi:zinc and cadmium transporter